MHAKKQTPTERVQFASSEWDAELNVIRPRMTLAAELNKFSFAEAPKFGAIFCKVAGQQVDETFNLILPLYTAGGREIRVGHRVFISQHCTICDMGGVEIGDLVVIGPNVNIIIVSYPLEPSKHHAYVEVRPIVID